MVQANVILRQVDGHEIGQRKDGYINATALCQAAGKRWNDYFAVSTSQEFLTELSADTQLPITSKTVIRNQSQGTALIETRTGRYGGTWVHPKVAIHLAQWASPRFAVCVSGWVLELATTGRVELTKPQTAKEPARIGIRESGKVARRCLTDVLQAHGVEGAGYAIATDALNRGIIGRSAREAKEQLGLPKHAQLRDHLSPVTLAKLLLAEEASAREIEATGVTGNQPCAGVCARKARSIDTAIAGVLGS